MPATTAKVFNSGNSQAIRLPREFRLDTEEVFGFAKGRPPRFLWAKRPGRWRK